VAQETCHRKLGFDRLDDGMQRDSRQLNWRPITAAIEVEGDRGACRNRRLVQAAARRRRVRRSTRLDIQVQIEFERTLRTRSVRLRVQ
jgi:hypothetical protein